MTQHIPEDPNDNEEQPVNDDCQHNHPIGKGSRWFFLYLAAVVALCIGLALCGPAEATSTVSGHWEATLTRSGAAVSPTPVGASEAEAWTACIARIPQSQMSTTQTSGNRPWKCATPRYVATEAFSPNPPCPARPADGTREVACPDPVNGMWTQTHGWISALAPTCWTATAYVPTSPLLPACQPAADTTAPTIGTLSAAATSGTQIRVSWAAATDNVGVTVYEIQHCRGVTCENFATLWTGTAIEYLHTVPVGSTTRFRHRARDAAGNWSVYSNVPTVTTTAAPPAGNSVLLTWTTPAQPEPVSAYRIVWGASPDEMVNTVQIAPAQSYTLSGLADGTWYAAVAVVLSGGNAAQSNTIQIVVPRDQTAAITWPSAPPPSAALFRDDFEFVAARAGAASSVFTSRGWTHVKSNNTDMHRGAGYIFTQPDAAVGSRVLVFESRPSESGDLGPGFEGGQTDYYLQLGMENAPTTTIPANVWFQFKTYATTESRFDTRDKTLYPCRTHYACSTLGGSLAWMFLWGSGGFEGVTGPLANRYIGVIAEHADFRGDAEYPTNKGKLFQNVSKAQLVAGRWYDLRLHFDTSGAQGVYQAWVRERGQSAWTQVADWRGEVTPNFSWPIPADQRVGHRVLRLPTTVNGPGDSTTYLDDFTMSASEAGLPL